MEQRLCPTCSRDLATQQRPSYYSFKEWNARRYCSRACAKTRNFRTRDTILRHVGVDQVTGCWRWTGTIQTGGYGQITFNSKHELAHRVSYEVFVGPIPESLTIDHLCRNRACVNPEHLEPVTLTANVLRGISPPANYARRTQCNHGHELAGANLLVRQNGGRVCRQCEIERHRRRRLAVRGSLRQDTCQHN